MRLLSSFRRVLGRREPAPPSEAFPAGYGDEEIRTYREAAPFTMTDKGRVLALIAAVRHVERHRVPGDIVECGVWKGGSMMVVARTLLNLGSTDRTLCLLDTFEGMVQPTGLDIGPGEYDPRPQFARLRFGDGKGSDWCYAPIAEVEANLVSTGYPATRLRFSKGKVEDTLPATAPERIALMRLDTDWYESTLWEMEHLYPLLSIGGVLIIDDYHFWDGARRAVDEYLARRQVRMLLVPVDGGAVVGVKEAGPH